MAGQQALSVVARDPAKENIQKGTQKRQKTSRYPSLPPMHPSREFALEKYESTQAQMSPLAMYQSERLTVGTTDHAQEKVDDWLNKNRIRVMSKLPKLDPLILANRGSNVSKYMNFIQPSPLCLKLPADGDTRQVKSRGNPDETKKETRKPKEHCPRLLRTLRTEKEMFALNPVVRVGGGYRRASWQVINALPGIQQPNLEDATSLTCVNCGVPLTVADEIREEKGRLRTIPNVISDCENCGKDNSFLRSSPETFEDVGRESVRETLAKGDSRFIVDHRRGRRRQCEAESKVQGPRSKVSRQSGRRRNSEGEVDSNNRVKMTTGLESPVDWRDDIDSFRTHMSRMEGEDEDLALEDKSKSSGQAQHSVLFLTELGASVEQIESPPNVRRAWDDGVTTNAVITREYEKDTNNWRNSYDVIAEDDHPELGISVKVRLANRPGGKLGHVASAPVSKLAAPKRPGNENPIEASGRFKARSHSTPDIRQHFKSEFGAVNRGARDDTTSSFWDGDGSLEGYLYEDIFLCPETPAPSTERSLSEENRAEQYKQEEEEGYEGEWLLEPANEGYLADVEGDIDLVALQAQLRGLQVKPQVQDMKEASTQENEEREFQTQRNDDASQKKAKNRWTQARPRDALGLDLDSDWESDGSLHVKPLSDLSLSSGEDDIESWRADIDQYRRAAIEHGADSVTEVKKARKDKGLFKQSSVGTAAIVSKPEEFEAYRAAAPQRGRASQKRGLKSRKTAPQTSSPPPSQGINRKGLRSVRGDDDLSESDLKYFTAQLESASFSKTRKEFNTTDSHCTGTTCFRCGSVIPQCEGTCAVCGAFCQRADGPCKACRGICENCAKPLDRCESREGALDSNEGEQGGDEFIVQDVQLPQPRDGPGSQRLEAESVEDSSVISENTNFAKSGKPQRVRRKRPPLVLKTKDTSSVKRVSKPRAEGLVRRNSDEPTEEQDSAEIDEDSITEEPLESAPVLQKPDSAIVRPSPPRSIKAARKTKPSRRVVSQTVVFKTKALDKSEQVPEQSSEPEVQDHGDEWKEETEDEDTESLSEEYWKLAVEKEQIPIDTQVKELNPEQTAEETTVKETKKKEKEKLSPETEVEAKRVVVKVRGVARVNAAFKERADLGKRLQRVMREAISNVIGEADRQTRRDSTIDYLAQYRLVDRARLEVYGRAFTLEDEDEDGIISYEQMLLALEGIPTITGMSRKQLMYVLQVLELGPLSRVTFKMFAVMIALCERVSTLDPLVKDLVEKLDLAAIESKLDLFKNIFYVTGDRSASFIRQRELRIELKAGGLSQNQEDHVISHILQSTNTGEISFLDYMAYIPLFLSIHHNICDNALDMSRDKYKVRK